MGPSPVAGVRVRLRLFAALLAATGALCAGSARPLAAEAVRVDAETSFQSVVVRPGDTLWSISHAYLKDPAKWDELLKHNRLPTTDPTVALPGMTLRVPIRLIKTSLRAAHVVFLVNKVLYRHKETAAWKGARMKMEVFAGDSLRTLEESKARVLFLNKDLLNLDQNSMAVVKPSEDPDADIVLKRGSVFAGKARVMTATALVTPRTGDTRYAASVDAALTTKVEVFSGAAAVDAQGARVVVGAGMQTVVAKGLAPALPVPLERPAELAERAQEFASSALNGGGAAPDPALPPPQPEPEADADTLRGDIQVLHVGQPIQAYHVQASVLRDFRKPVFDRRYGADAEFSAADSDLKPGAYWWRVSAVDLLGVEGAFHAPHYYTVGVKRVDPENERLASMLVLASPENNAEVSDAVQVAGYLRDERLTVEVNGVPIKTDAEGRFSLSLKTHVGGNTIVVTVSDGHGNQSSVSRHVTRL